MSTTRRQFLKTGARGAVGLSLGTSLGVLPQSALSADLTTATVAFSGTGCTRDEGERSRPESDMRIYLPSSGYIPVRIRRELGGYGRIVRGVGENDWYVPRDNSEALTVGGPLDISSSNNLAHYIRNYISGNQFSRLEQAEGYSMSALALHGANLAASSGAQQFNFIGHSRGAVECIMAAWFLYAYGNAATRNIPINIFAIDPVPGPGTWYSIFTQLPPNVARYVGVYAWDHGIQASSDHLFQAVVPRPNGQMRGESNVINLHQLTTAESVAGFHAWMVLANDAQQRNPLAPSTAAQPVNYELYACRGRHSTVSGNRTADSLYNPAKASASVAPVPALIYKMARGYLTSWGTTFIKPCAVAESVPALRRKIHADHRLFDKMGGGETRNSSIANRPYVRRVSSIMGANPLNTYYMDNVVGDPPYKLAFPVTKDRTAAGWVKWKFL